MTYTSLPQGVSPPFAENNAHNHTGLIIIFASVCLFLTLSSLAMRIYATTQRSMVLSDDYLLGVAVAVAITQTSIIFYQTHLGWGKSSELLDPSHTEAMVKSVYASDLLYILILGLSKCCTSLLYQHLSTHATRWIPRSILGASIVWTIVAVILVAVRCSRTHPWTDINDKCSDLQPHWTVITTLDILLELLLFIYPIKLIYSLRLRRSRKLTVLALLGSRGMFLIPLTIIHYTTLLTQLHSTNPTLHGFLPTILKEIYLATSVLLLTLSSFKLLIAVYEDEDGLAYYYTSEGAGGGGVGSRYQVHSTTQRRGRSAAGVLSASRSSNHFSPTGGRSRSRRLEQHRRSVVGGRSGGSGGGGGGGDGDTIEEEPILKHAQQPQSFLGIRKDVRIQVTSEVVIELEERGVGGDSDGVGRCSNSSGGDDGDRKRRSRRG